MSKHGVGALVLLNCRHRVHFREPVPVVGEVVYCVRCNAEATVHAAPDEWRMKCRNCHVNRPYGVERIACELAASRHAQKYPHHVVVIMNGKQPVVTLGDTERRSERAAATTRDILRDRYERAAQGTLFSMGEDTGTDAPF